MGQITKLCRVFFFLMVAFIRVNTVFIMHLVFAMLTMVVCCGVIITVAPISQLVKLQNEVVRNAKNVMTFWPCDFSSFICEPWSNIVKFNTCQLKYIFIITPYIQSRLISSCPLYMSNIMTQGSAFIQHLNPSTFRIDN